MEMVRWGGRRGDLLPSLWHEMDNLFGRFFGDWGRPLPGQPDHTWWPTVDVAEHPDAVVVRADLPGLKADDIQVSFLEGTLTVKGEKKECDEDRGDGYRHVERRYGAFRRDIRVPGAVDTDRIEATCRDGVLTVRLPRTEAAKGKLIPVKT